MKYYLVALFDKDSYSFVENIQKSICRKYKLYRKLPVLHITLEVIDDPDLDELDKIVTNFIKPYKKFKVELNGVICFEPPFKSVNLKVEHKGYIMRIARNINDKLKLTNFNVRQNIDNWDLHVSLANTNYATRKWSSEEYKIACENTKQLDPQRMAKIDRIELWKPINNKKTMTVKSYVLKEY
ncbi:2'-5' RNA ligase superfamily protein [Clostridium acidisoli DSM 12555]|jgi:2'-5' RNA ligase|uniref:2'-5' RNA ligase superfamily protein n=1 Tax=Clostridium acidisoli DSM 12555 TaxID=1121291 RepID=A0A1W1XQZ3_9CLOT|nr:2'-5' RNA ligase family protein [Clostridium acidisoli]SMC26294.1 2'-5' RNA ligase superfamily protein [Clostridium acidisoli DSM 12555]